MPDYTISSFIVSCSLGTDAFSLANNWLWEESPEYRQEMMGTVGWNDLEYDSDGRNQILDVMTGSADWESYKEEVANVYEHFGHISEFSSSLDL